MYSNKTPSKERSRKMFKANVLIALVLLGMVNRKSRRSVAGPRGCCARMTLTTVIVLSLLVWKT